MHNVDYKHLTRPRFESSTSLSFEPQPDRISHWRRPAINKERQHYFRLYCDYSPGRVDVWAAHNF